MTGYPILKDKFIQNIKIDAILSQQYEIIAKALAFGEEKHRNQKTKYDQ